MNIYKFCLKTLGTCLIPAIALDINFTIYIYIYVHVSIYVG